MKFKIDDINKLSDSKQVMDIKPNKFIKIFIYIILSMAIIFIIWAWFSEKEIVIKVNGVVKPYEDIQNISNLVQGEVKVVNMKNGEEVKKGDILFQVNTTELENQKKQLEAQISDVDTDIGNLENLTKAINDNINYLENNEKEKEYYYKFKSYEAEIKGIENENSNKIDSKESLLNKKEKLEILNKSIMDNKNYNEKNSSYSEEYKSYSNSKTITLNKIEQLEENKENLKKEINADSVEPSMIEKNKEIQNQINQINLQIKNSNQELDKLKNDIVAQIKANIEKINAEIIVLDKNSKNVDTSIKSIQEKIKFNILAQIEEKINLDNQKKQELIANKNQIDENIDKATIKAPVDGKLKINTELEKGTILQSGANIATILPSGTSYKVKFIIPTKDIANIKIGKDIRYNFEALSYREYGSLSGKVENLSPDAISDNQKGISFYIGEGSLNKNVLYNAKREEGIIKPGMNCEVIIKIRKIRMLYYILNQLGLKTNE